jgi:predicted kinase
LALGLGGFAAHVRRRDVSGALLIAFAGLPGTGKTTLARAIADDLGATYVRIDSIEQALRPWIPGDMGPAGYVVAYALAADNLRLGRTVVADSVNPIGWTREAWRRAAAEASARLVEIEIVCSDADEHRRRVESRVTDVPRLVLPTWQDVIDRQYEPWDTQPLVIDTANKTVGEALEQLRKAIAAARK